MEQMHFYWLPEHLNSFRLIQTQIECHFGRNCFGKLQDTTNGRKREVERVTEEEVAKNFLFLKNTV